MDQGVRFAGSQEGSDAYPGRGEPVTIGAGEDDTFALQATYTSYALNSGAIFTITIDGASTTIL